MPATFLSLHYHVVFGTKDRMPLIDSSWRPRLHGYLGGTVRSLGGIPEAVGGVADHVHLLIGLKATHCLSDFMRDLKRGSTSWVHENIPGGQKFKWQEGYAAFTVSATSRDGVKDYIANQEEHHGPDRFVKNGSPFWTKQESPTIQSTSFNTIPRPLPGVEFCRHGVPGVFVAALLDPALMSMIPDGIRRG